jgi:DNA-binding transcriptional LysR family regulator
MELRHIRYFLAVAEERHFTRAAAKVGIGQPPLSQQIKDLEGEVGAALFHRVAHGAELTEAGKSFLAGVKEIPLTAERATMAARRAARRVRFVSASRDRRHSTSLYCRQSAPFAAPIPTSISRSKRPM